MKSNNHGSTFRMDAYTGDKKEGQKVESTFAYDAMMGQKKEAVAETAAEAPTISTKGENPVKGQNAGSNFRMDAYAGEKKEGQKSSAFDFNAIIGKKK